MRNTEMSRRGFLAGSLTATALAQETGLHPDLRTVISRADVIYDRPVARSEEGLPIGNGRMGSLVWTTPRMLRFQINRVDVYANNSASNSFFERHNDYCGGCAYLDLDFGPREPFPEAGFPQRLSVYDGDLSIEGRGATARIFGWQEQDVIAVTLRGEGNISAVLRMLRYQTKYFGADLETLAREHAARVQTFGHTATSRLIARGERIALEQEFREGGFCCKSAVALAFEGRTAKPRIVNETEVALDASGGESYTLLIASAATFDSNEDVVAAAFAALDAAQSRTAAKIAEESRSWWHRFWSGGHLELSSAEGDAELLERHWHYYLYLMASASRGKFPPKFNGMLWNTGGDLRTWGAQHWFANLSCYYEALPATGRLDLMDPMFEMYTAMLPACENAARQQWGSAGMYIPETVYFDGLEVLPDDIAAEMRDLYLLRKPWEQRSDRFMEYARTKHPHSSRWNWIEAGEWRQGRWTIKERGSGPYGNVSHIFGTTAKIAYLYWRRYEYTLDREWLRARAYPMLKAAAEFYRNHPNVKAGEDGRIHIHWANSNESVYGARDTDEDLSAMRGVLAAAARASQILEADDPLRAQWKDFSGRLAPLPTSDDPEALKPAGYQGPRVFVRGLKPAVKTGGGLTPDANSLPMWFFDLCHVESRDADRLRIARETFAYSLRNGLTPRTPVSVLSKLPIAAASLGLADAFRVLAPNQIRALAPERATAYRNGGVLANRMTLREGPQALDAQRLGRAAEAVNLALLASSPPSPGEDPILHLFPAWPREWNARFTLLARGAFLVTSSMRGGAVEFVEIESKAGALCRLRNPFSGEAVLYRNGQRVESLRGSVLEIRTSRGERLVIAPPAGPNPAR